VREKTEFSLKVYEGISSVDRYEKKFFLGYNSSFFGKYKNIFPKC
jgi:hypothetical protein